MSEELAVKGLLKHHIECLLGALREEVKVLRSGASRLEAEKAELRSLAEEDSRAAKLFKLIYRHLRTNLNRNG
jgi:hypothetical protein